jgi:hypothetical protein
VKTTVPIDIRPPFERALGNEEEAWSMSSSRNRAGDPGETWIVATKTRLLIGDRSFGGDIAIKETPLSGISSVEIEGASFGSGRAVLMGKAGALDAVCFSSLERDDFAGLGSRIVSKKGEVPMAEPVVLGDAKQRWKKKRPEDGDLPLAAAAHPGPPSRRKPLPPRAGRVPSGGAFDLFLDSAVAFPGQPLTGVLRLHWPSARSVRGVRLHWNGRETTRITVGSGKHSRTYRNERVWAARKLGLFGDSQSLGFFGAVGDALSPRAWHPLAAGVYEYPFEFNLPAGSPSTYSGLHANVQYELFAEVDIPRAFDLTTRFPVRVIAASPEMVKGHRWEAKGSVVVSAWTNGGKVGPGVVVTGGFNIRNPGGKNIRAVKVQVIRVEHATAGGHSRRSESIESGIRFPGPRFEGDVPFSIALPTSYNPWHGDHSSINYVVRVDLDVAWAFDVAVNLDT